MKARAIFIALAASWTCQAFAAAPSPTSVDLPRSNLWCVSSQPIDVQSDGANGVTFGDLVFQQLYLRLEAKAQAATLDTIGVPFLESSTAKTTAAAPTAAAASQAPVAPAPQKQFVLRVCAIVPSVAAAATPPPGVELLARPAMKVAASLCDSSDAKGCEQSLSAYLKATYGLDDSAISSVDWRVSQPLSNDPSAAALARSLSDSSLRSLRKEIPQADPPRDINIVWTPVPH